MNLSAPELSAVAPPPSAPPSHPLFGGLRKSSKKGRTADAMMPPSLLSYGRDADPFATGAKRNNKKGLRGKVKGALRRMVSHDESGFSKPVMGLRGDESTTSHTTNNHSVHSTRTKQFSPQQQQQQLQDSGGPMNNSGSQLAESSGAEGGRSPKHNITKKFNESMKNFLSNISPLPSANSAKRQQHKRLVSISSNAPLTMPFDLDHGDEDEDSYDDDGDDDSSLDLDLLKETKSRRDRRQKKKKAHHGSDTLHASSSRLKQYRRVPTNSSTAAAARETRSASPKPRARSSAPRASKQKKLVLRVEEETDIDVQLLSGETFLLSVLDHIHARKAASGELQVKPSDGEEAADSAGNDGAENHTQKKTKKSKREKDKKHKRHGLVKTDKSVMVRTCPNSDTDALSPEEEDGIPLLTNYSEDNDMKRGLVGDIRSDEKEKEGNVSISTPTEPRYEGGHDQEATEGKHPLQAQDSVAEHLQKSEMQDGDSILKAMNDEDSLMIPLNKRKRFALMREVENSLRDLVVPKRKVQANPSGPIEGVEPSVGPAHVQHKGESDSAGYYKFMLSNLMVVTKPGTPPTTMDDIAIPNLKARKQKEGELRRPTGLVRRRSCTDLTEETIPTPQYSNSNTNLENYLDGDDYWNELLGGLISLPNVRDPRGHPQDLTDDKRRCLEQAFYMHNEEHLCRATQTEASVGSSSRRGRSRHSRKRISTTNGEPDRRENMAKSKSDSKRHLDDSRAKKGPGSYSLKQHSDSQIDTQAREISNSSSKPGNFLLSDCRIPPPPEARERSRSKSRSQRDAKMNRAAEAAIVREQSKSRRNRMSISEKRFEQERERERSQSASKEDRQDAAIGQSEKRDKRRVASPSKRTLVVRSSANRHDSAGERNRSKSQRESQRRHRNSTENKDRNRSKSKSSRGHKSSSRRTTSRTERLHQSESQLNSHHDPTTRSSRKRSKSRRAGHDGAFDHEDKRLSKSANDAQSSRRGQSLEANTRINAGTLENEDAKFRAAKAISQRRLHEMDGSRKKVDSSRDLKQGDHGNRRASTGKKRSTTERLHKSEGMLEYDHRQSRSKSKSKRGRRGEGKLDESSKQEGSSERKGDKSRRRSAEDKSTQVDDSDFAAEDKSARTRNDSKDKDRVRSRSIERARRSRTIVNNAKEELQKIRRSSSVPKEGTAKDETMKAPKVEACAKGEGHKEHGTSSRKSQPDGSRDHAKKKKSRKEMGYGGDEIRRSSDRYRSHSQSKLHDSQNQISDEEHTSARQKEAKADDTTKRSSSTRKSRQTVKDQGRKCQSERQARTVDEAVVASSIHSSSSSERNGRGVSFDPHSSSDLKLNNQAPAEIPGNSRLKETKPHLQDQNSMERSSWSGIIP